MKILVSSGKYQEIIELNTVDRRVAHRIGCLRAVESGKELGQVIRSSTHLKSRKPQDDDLWTATEVIEDSLRKE